MLIECPKCGFQGKIDATKIPEQGARLTCRQCQEKFSVSPPASPQGTVPAPELSRQQPTPPPTNPAVSAAAAQPATSSSPDENRQWTCSLCGENFARHELVRFGEKLVCGNCKPAYVQMLQEGVAHSLDMRYAGFWVRFAAKFIDGILLWILFIPFSLLFSPRVPIDPQHPAAISAAIPGLGIMYLIQVIIPAAMTCFFLGRFQATPGKMALGLIVVNPERGRISYLRALGRHFSEWISAMILCFGYLMAAFSKEKCALHDRICSTRVVYKK